METAQKEQPQQPKAPMWHEALIVLLDGYTPATSLKDSTHQLSTAEIKKSLMQHTGEEIYTQELTEMLINMSFKYERTGNLELEWLFKQG